MREKVYPTSQIITNNPVIAAHKSVFFGSPEGGDVRALRLAILESGIT